MSALPAAGATNTSTFLAHCFGRHAFRRPLATPMLGAGGTAPSGRGSTVEVVVMGTDTVVAASRDQRGHQLQLRGGRRRPQVAVEATARELRPGEALGPVTGAAGEVGAAGLHPPAGTGVTA